MKNVACETRPTDRLSSYNLVPYDTVTGSTYEPLPLGWNLSMPALIILQLISWEVDLLGVDLVGVDFVRVDLVGLTRANKVRNGPATADQGSSLASQGSCHVHGTLKATSHCRPRLFSSQPRQLPCARHSGVNQGSSLASQGSCHVHSTPGWTKALL